jgi:hypothetical protein
MFYLGGGGGVRPPPAPPPGAPRRPPAGLRPARKLRLRRKIEVSHSARRTALKTSRMCYVLILFRCVPPDMAVVGTAGNPVVPKLHLLLSHSSKELEMPLGLVGRFLRLGLSNL